MLVRCGRCRAELEVSGPGEFVCPACGTRNAVRDAPAQDPFGVPDLGGAPGGASPFSPPPPPPDEPAAGVTWIRCPSCSYRFALGEVEEVGCPACGSSLRVVDGRAEVV